MLVGEAHYITRTVSQHNSNLIGTCRQVNFTLGAIRAPSDVSGHVAVSIPQGGPITAFHRTHPSFPNLLIGHWDEELEQGQATTGGKGKPPMAGGKD